jgi:hypothetical protein
MNQQAVVSTFSHVKPGDTEFKGGGLRDFFLYRDLGIADATGGQVICHLVKANPDLPPEEGTGWHKHECEFQIVIMTKGWARFMYEDKSSTSGPASRITSTTTPRTWSTSRSSARPISRPSTCRRPSTTCRRRRPGSDGYVVPRGINLRRRPLAAADCCGAGCGAPPRIADDI